MGSYELQCCLELARCQTHDPRHSHLAHHGARFDGNHSANGCRHTNTRPEQIHSAFRRLCEGVASDIHPGSFEPIVRMARVNVAKSVLLDGSTRAAFDLRTESRPRFGSCGSCSVANKFSRTFDGNAAPRLVIVAPLEVALRNIQGAGPTRSPSREPAADSSTARDERDQRHARL